PLVVHLEEAMIPSSPRTANARIPFLSPPIGRPNPPHHDRVGRVRDRLNSRQARRSLDRLAGDMSWPKRLTDVTVSAAALVVLSPLLIAVAALIMLTDFGPVLYWQRRVGRRGRQFWFPKFRSMVPGADLLAKLLAAQNDHAKRPTGEACRRDVTFKMKND